MQEKLCTVTRAVHISLPSYSQTQFSDESILWTDCESSRQAHSYVFYEGLSHARTFLTVGKSDKVPKACHAFLGVQAHS